MITLEQIQMIVADSFLGGNLSIAGMAIFFIVMLTVFVLIKDKQSAMILMIPLTLIFSVLGVLDTNLTVILIVIAVVSIAMKARKVWDS